MKQSSQKIIELALALVLSLFSPPAHPRPKPPLPPKPLDGPRETGGHHHCRCQPHAARRDPRAGKPILEVEGLTLEVKEFP